MRLTVLGSSASYADAGRACAGYLVRCGSTSVLFDCGNGVIANLSRVLEPTALDAVFITHEHIDHFADIYALQAALRYAPSGPAPSLPLYVPVGLFAKMGAVLGTTGRAELAEAFDVHEIEEGVPLHVGALTVSAHRVDHVEPTYALRAMCDGSRLVYTSDTRAGAAARAASAGADLLVADATLPDEYAGRSAHMTATEAGQLAHDCGARSLVLTHLWPSVDRVKALADAARVFRGPVTVAQELEEISIGEEE
ncbi:MAG: MBL fold metallo-hydrolase [Coriobacteriales bacterium]